MNKSHITDEQVKSVLQTYWEDDNPSKTFSNTDKQDMRAALEAAFPEPSIQELLRDEERSARHYDPQQPATFGPLVVTEQIALQLWHEINETKTSLREPLQSFVNRHSIKPIAFADRTPENQNKIYIYGEGNYWSLWHYTDGIHAGATHWLPASALPIPEPDVDAKEAAWIRFRDSRDEINDWTDKEAFEYGYKAAQQAGGAK